MSKIIQISPITDIGGWGFGLRDLMDQLRGFDGSIIEVPINSYGGEIFEGLAIYNTLKGRREKVRVKIIGYAMSMGTVIAMAGDEVIMPENSFFMIHNPWTIAMGDYQDLAQESEFLEVLANELALIYANRTGLSLARIREMMDAETWLTAPEALELGFVDRLTSGVRFEASLSKREMEALYNIPDTLKNNVEMSKKKNLLNALTEAVENFFGSAKEETPAEAHEETASTTTTEEDIPGEDPENHAADPAENKADEPAEAITEETEEVEAEEPAPDPELIAARKKVNSLEMRVAELEDSMLQVAGFIDRLPEMLAQKDKSEALAARLVSVEKAISENSKVKEGRSNSVPGEALSEAEKTFKAKIKRPRIPTE